MFVYDEFGNLTWIPRNLCFAEAEGAGEGAAGSGGGGGADGAKAAEGAAEAAAKAAAKAAGEAKAAAGADGTAKAETGKAEADAAAKDPAAADWRAGLKDEEAKKFAERSPDLDHLIKRAKEANDRLSKAIIPPGKDAKPEEIDAYRKQIGVPSKPEEYRFEMPEGMQPSEEDKAFHARMGQTFHELNITAAQATGLNKVWNDLTVAAKQHQIAEDKKAAEKAEAELRQSWGPEFEINKAHADRAATQMFGDQLEEARHMETKDGRFVMDHPVMLRALAVVGREMAEGGLVPPMSADAAERAGDELRALRGKIAEAQGRGDNAEANRLYQKEQALLKKMGNTAPIVGSQGRAA